MKNLILIRGIPGSGKSTLAELFSADLVIAADDCHLDADGSYRFKSENIKAAHQWCQKSVENAMKHGGCVVVHNTFTTAQEMEPYFAMAKQHGYMVHTIIVENRHGSINIHNVPENVIDAMIDRFEIKIS